MEIQADARVIGRLLHGVVDRGVVWLYRGGGSGRLARDFTGRQRGARGWDSAGDAIFLLRMASVGLSRARLGADVAGIGPERHLGVDLLWRWPLAAHLRTLALLCIG